MKQIYICRKCGKIVISEAMQEKYCTEDGGEYFNTEISEEAWNAMDDAAKNNVITSVTGGVKPQPAPKAQETSSTQEKVNDAMNHAGAAAAAAGATIGAAAKTAGASIKSSYEKSTVLYNNIGNKICSLAKIVAWIGIIVSCLIGIITMVAGIGIGMYSRSSGIGSVLAGILIAGIGSLSSWIGSMVLYGFGHLIIKTDEIAEKIK